MITAGGLHGDVVELDDTVVHVEVAAGVVLRVDRRAVAARVETPADGVPFPETTDDLPS